MAEGSRISVKRLPSGYYHVRGVGPENWTQPPEWPCDERTLREHAGSLASEAFIRAAARRAAALGETET